VGAFSSAPLERFLKFRDRIFSKLRGLNGNVRAHFDQKIFYRFNIIQFKDVYPRRLETIGIEGNQPKIRNVLT
jgi:hypothetical protein